MNIKPIKTEQDYESTLARIDALFHVENDSPESDELSILIVLVDAYENEHYKVDLPDPVDAIKYVMEQNHLKRRDLEPYIGNRSLVSLVLSHKRRLSLAMIRKLHKALHIPLEVLINEPTPARI